MLKQTEGSRAVAEAVGLCRPDVICAYPISPQTHIVEGLGEMVKNGALSPCDQLRSQATPSTLSCSAYHGTSTRPVAPTMSQAMRARRCGVITRYFGAELISFSQRSSSRLRVSAAPNFVKS